MVKHMIIWKFKDDVSDKKQAALDIKIALEGLVGKIDGLVEMHILTESFDTSTGDIMMDSSFTDAKALDNYQRHPLHQSAANTFVRPFMEQRLSFDYKI
ncbi:MAG: Dabb family protein [Ruminococcaceae bacterium]|nr:Dabb family protein [Oscillospiraceae bacterium]